MYNLQRKQFLPISIAEAWDFFSVPQNLSKITPAHLGFKILYISGIDAGAYAGQVIRYRIKILPGISVHWVTEITHVKDYAYFVDEQRFGPYTMWHHQHHFKEVNGGVEMTDELNYAIPMGILGRLAHLLFVKKEVNQIFDFRFRALEKFFSDQRKERQGETEAARH